MTWARQTFKEIIERPALGQNLPPSAPAETQGKLGKPVVMPAIVRCLHCAMTILVARTQYFIMKLNRFMAKLLASTILASAALAGRLEVLPPKASGQFLSSTRASDPQSKRPAYCILG